MCLNECISTICLQAAKLFRFWSNTKARPAKVNYFRRAVSLVLRIRYNTKQGRYEYGHKKCNNENSSWLQFYTNKHNFGPYDAHKKAGKCSKNYGS